MSSAGTRQISSVLGAETEKRVTHPCMFERPVRKKTPHGKMPRNDLYHADFRGAQFDHNSLVPSGFRSLYGLRLLQPETRGLHASIPHHQGRWKSSLGFLPLMKLRGNFEIRVTYELLLAEPPETGVGAGANLYILAENTLHGASLRRCVTARGEDVFWVHATLLDEGRERKRISMHFPAHASGGTVCLRRTGAVLHFVVTEDEDEEPKKLYEVEFGEDVVGLVRVEVTTDGNATAVENIWKEFSLEAETLERVDVPLFRARSESLR